MKLGHGENSRPGLITHENNICIRHLQFKRDGWMDSK